MQWLLKRKRNRLYTYIHVCAQHNTHTYIQLQHFPVSPCNVPLVVYANVQKITKLYLKTYYNPTFLAFRSSRVSIFLGGGVSAGSCVYPRN